jgi:hypothetical protein
MTRAHRQPFGVSLDYGGTPFVSSTWTAALDSVAGLHGYDADEGCLCLRCVQCGRAFDVLLPVRAAEVPVVPVRLRECGFEVVCRGCRKGGDP